MAKFCLYFLGVAVLIGIANAATEDEINAARAAIRPFMETCGKEYEITRDEVLAAKAAGTLDTLDSCFHACLFKKMGFIDSKGFFDTTVAVEKNKKYFKSEEDLKEVERIAKTCSFVNDETVSDGDKACERAKLLLTCLLREKANFNPFGSS